MTIRLFKPQNILLKNFIEYFYVLTKSAEEATISYLTFPNIYSMVSINYQADIKSCENKIIVNYDEKKTIVSGLAVCYRKPLIIEYSGTAKEITICFKPLGLNAFLERPLENYTKSRNIELSFNPFDDFMDTMKTIMQIPSDDIKIDAMENYWISKLRGFMHPFLHQVLNDLLLPSAKEISIADIARKNGTTHKTIIRHFKQYAGKSPSDFRKIVRFRNAMKHKVWANSYDNLTEITYLSDYFDQSHMIKDFKGLTGFTPKEFFNKLNTSHEGKMSWIFLGEG